MTEYHDLDGTRSLSCGLTVPYSVATAASAPVCFRACACYFIPPAASNFGRAGCLFPTLKVAVYDLFFSSVVDK
jgi:hypothetical protein